MHMDDIYDQVSFRHIRSGEVKPGVIGWRDDQSPWVTLQVWDGPSVQAASKTLEGAYREACGRLARRGYIPVVHEGRFKISQEQLSNPYPWWPLAACTIVLLATAVAAYYMLLV